MEVLRVWKSCLHPPQRDSIGMEVTTQQDEEQPSCVRSLTFFHWRCHQLARRVVCGSRLPSTVAPSSAPRCFSPPVSLGTPGRKRKLRTNWNPLAPVVRAVPLEALELRPPPLVCSMHELRPRAERHSIRSERSTVEFNQRLSASSRVPCGARVLAHEGA